MKAINKNIFREISKSKGRFLSIFLICAIGVGFFSGVKATCDDMKISADDLYDKQQLFDLRVLSTFGLTDDDAAAIAEVEGVSAVYTSKYTDMAVYHNDSEYLTRIYSWNDNEVNKIILHDGRFPEKDDECLISGNKLYTGIRVGDTVSVVDLTDAEEFPLENKEYTVVGTFDTPMYVSMTQKGSTTIGDGGLDSFMYITNSNFKQDVYTEIYIKSDEMAAVRSYSDEYERLRDDISDKLEELGISRSEIRYDEVVGEALEEIADGEKELADAKAEGEKELSDAAAEIEDAKQQIADGEKELADAKAEIEDGEKQLADAEKELADARKEIDEGKAQLNDSKLELIDAEKTLSESKLEIDKGEQELSQALSEINAGEKELTAAQAELDKNRAEIEAAKQQLSQAREQLAAGKAEYDAGLAQYEAGYAQFVEGEKQLQAAIAQYGEDNPIIIQQKVELETNRTILEQTKAQLDVAKAELDAAETEILANEQTVTAGEEQLDAAQLQLDAAVEELAQGKLEYEAGKASLEEGKAQYLDGYKQYLDGLTQYSDALKQIEDAEKQYEEGKSTLEEKRAEFEDGKRQYEEGIAELEDAKQQLADGITEYEDGLATFNTEIADAERELADAKQKIEDAGEAKWYIFTRDDNPGYAEYESNAERIDKIAAIFPVFFLLVAGLVCLTTMSRMVEENRTQVGTLKALGYSNAAIMRHYMVYALSAALSGSIVGTAGGMILFPGVIMYAYSMMYIIDEPNFGFDPINIVVSTGLMVAAIAFTVFFSCKRVLAETPASLMRPRAPKAGKRVLLERIGFIWNRLGFFAKVSGRNLFRYKRRMFMTVVGIAGCTALMLTGFGLKDAISDIVSLQYGDIYSYSGYVAVADDISSEEEQDIYDELLDYNKDTISTRALIKQYTTSFGDNNCQCYITAVEDVDIFEGMVDLHERVSKEKLTLTNGAICTEKLSKLLGISEGDTITVQISDSESSTVQITGITEHYSSHYLYLTEDMYSDVFGENPPYNMVYFSNGMSDDEAEIARFSEKLMALNGVMAVITNSDTSEAFSEMLGILDLVIIVLIASAGALAFVVLYNLTNVNITERIREIATLKVLGFYDREVSSYVFRENIILSIMGSVVGLVLGVFLCQFVVQTAEIDEVMFGREIHFMSYVWAFIITAAFSLIVNLIMTTVLKRISMVESLKSVE